MKQNHVRNYVFLALLLLLTPCIAYQAYHRFPAVRAQEAIPSKTTASIIVLDAGHGGYDSGGVSVDGVYEKDLTLAITLKLGTMLEAQGYRVVYTRTTDSVSWPADNKQDLASRVAIAQKAQADLYLSLHLNASVYGDGARGFEIYTDGRNTLTTPLAAAIEENFSALSYTTNRGSKTTSDRSLYVIDKNEVPALLLELGFLTDSQDMAYLQDSAFQQRLAQAIADGISQQL